MASNRNNNTHYRPMRQQQPREENRDVRNSKYLAYILRYGAADHGLKMRPDGYVLVSDILELPDARRRRLSVVIIRRIVATNDKRRFELSTDADSDELLIRAIQGHGAMLAIDSEKAMQRITDADRYPLVVHGVYRHFWRVIKVEGLHREERKHIQFATAMNRVGMGISDNGKVVSGERDIADVFIEIDLSAALADGIPFYVASNEVVLTEGIDGVLPPRYFKRVTDRTGKLIQ